MYLKSLSLKGFKSFADRSVLSLEPGVTAIVGPNGSGKSNISDSVLWVLGERNAKNLRGQVMEDVIFAGSSARKSVGVAEVDLVLDNSDGSLPVDYTEVSVTRRMYRSGESEYLINGSAARRMDVLDILHDSGLGTGTYSIISQGNLDSILQSKPEDRRALIEEAAGVLKHKQRKLKSERRIEQMEQHLERVQDIVNEVSRQLGPLERKAKKAATYQDLSAQLTQLSLSLAVDDVRVLQGKWNDICAQIASLEELLEQRRAGIGQAEAESERIQGLIRNGSESLTELARQHRAVSEQVERLDSQVILLQEKLRSARVRSSELEALMESNDQRVKMLSVENQGFEQELSELQEKLAAAHSRVDELEREHSAAALQLSALERDVFSHQSLRREVEKEEQTIRNNYTRTKEKLDMAQSRASLFDERMDGLQEAFDQATQAYNASLEQGSALDEQLAAATREQDEARIAFNQAKESEKQAKSAHDAAIREERQLAAQMIALEQLERESLAQASAARAWLEGDQQKQRLDVSPLLHEIKVEPGFDLLVERLLDADVSALLVKDGASAANVAREMGGKGLSGLVTLLLRNDSARFGASAVDPLLLQVNNRELLINHVTSAPAAQEATRALLGNVVVCKDLADALELHGAAKAPLCAATLQGDIVFPDGRVVLGKTAENEAEGALARSRRLEALRESHRKSSLELNECAQAAQTAADAVKKLQDALLEKGQQLAQVCGMVSSVKNEQTLAKKRLDQAKNELESAQRQRKDVQRTIDQATPQVQEFQELLQAASEKVAQEKLLVTQSQDAVAPARTKEAQLAHDLADAKLKEAMLSEREVYLRRVLQTRAEELEKLAESDKKACASLAVQKRIVRRAVPLIATLNVLGESARARARALEDASEEKQHAAAGTRQQADEAATALREARAAYEQVNEELGQVRIEKGRLEIQVESSVSLIAKEYDLPLEQALELPSLEDRGQIEQEVFALKRRITNMGNINPDAAAEYDELKVRYDYLSSQLADLRSARTALRKINDVIDERMKDDFARTFAVANENFKEIFADLFPGGTAELLLVDPQDMEHTGVEVVAQPRGKKISKMSLMSGGEKSLVALALLFAVYRIRNTPFYILDEVEAALDDTNLRRLIAYLNKLRESTQLIMITHQRRTMEMADVLFGVSMQADGVTKVISQRLEHALQYAE